MTVSAYAQLQSEILDTLNRTDLAAEVTEYTPGPIDSAVKRAIARAERRIVRRLRTREFETSTTVATVAGTETVALPADFAMMKTLMVAGDPVSVLAQKDLTTLYNDYPSAGPGKPTAYAPFGAALYLRPVPDTARSLKMFYYSQPTPLSDENTSNTLIAKYPDLLLYGALIEITAHIEDDGRIGLWKAAFEEAINDIVNDNTMNRWSGAPIRGTVDARSII